MHYRGGRADTPFWRHIKENCNEQLASERISAWQNRLPNAADFDSFLGVLPHVEAQLAQLYYPILDGLGLLQRKLAKAELAKSSLAEELAHEGRSGQGDLDQGDEPSSLSTRH